MASSALETTLLGKVTKWREFADNHDAAARQLDANGRHDRARGRRDEANLCRLHANEIETSVKLAESPVEPAQHCPECGSVRIEGTGDYREADLLRRELYRCEDCQAVAVPRPVVSGPSSLALLTLATAMDEEAHQLEGTGYAPLAKRVRRWATLLRPADSQSEARS